MMPSEVGLRPRPCPLPARSGEAGFAWGGEVDGRPGDARRYVNKKPGADLL